MYSLSVAEAQYFVKKKIDEQENNDSVMMDYEDEDNEQLLDLVATLLPESINEVHAALPVQTLDGETLTYSELASVSVSSLPPYVMTIPLEKEFLRLIRFNITERVGDVQTYGPVVAEVVPEYSAEGRMQNNPYTRATHDRPRLVLRQGKVVYNQDEQEYSHKTILEYHSAFTPNPLIQDCEYIPRYRYNYQNPVTSYKVAENAVDAIINHLVGKVLEVYGNERAKNYLLGSQESSNTEE